MDVWGGAFPTARIASLTGDQGAHVTRGQDGQRDGQGQCQKAEAWVRAALMDSVDQLKKFRSSQEGGKALDMHIMPCPALRFEITLTTLWPKPQKPEGRQEAIAMIQLGYCSHLEL